ncbi:MAG: DNA-protecting protein DprA, partial [Acidimicrobiia bacterium]|nr:DNA-protecting protein DprA [Acidimicrobiia bacterium]
AQAAPSIAAMLHPPVAAAWRASAAQRPPERWAGVCRAAGITVVTDRDREFPELLRRDPQPPAALFVRGDLTALDVRRVGVVGTRNATRAGRQVAFELGRDLAAADVAVVSGLAKGIDGAAHRGTLSIAAGRPVAVVGNGPDTPYPRQHAELWAAVCERGVLLSEWPPGSPPEAFHFPLRNRILAALSEVLVVVESRERGGSLITAQAALERSVDVMAVPGSVRNRAACGTNELLRDGAAPVTSADDVLIALGLDTRRAGRASFDPRPLPRGLDADVLRRCRRDPCTLDELVVDLAVPITDAAMAVARLERSGWIGDSGGWFEAVGSWPTR